MQARGDESSGGRLAVIAHSLGCKIASKALSQALWVMNEQLQRDISTQQNYANNSRSGCCAEVEVARGLVRGQVAGFAFMAPDMDVRTFQERMRILNCKGMVTVYCASDRALNASAVICIWRWVCGHTRAGSTSAIRQHGLRQDTIDYTGHALDVIQHSAVHTSPAVSCDVAQALAGVEPGLGGRQNLILQQVPKVFWLKARE